MFYLLSFRFQPHTLDAAQKCFVGTFTSKKLGTHRILELGLILSHCLVFCLCSHVDHLLYILARHQAFIQTPRLWVSMLSHALVFGGSNY